MLSFQESLVAHGLDLRRKPLEILQINVGKFCNQACSHCHVEAGPKRTEMMERKTVERLLELLDRSSTIHCVDITGGAPELNPQFRYLVREASKILTRPKGPLRGRLHPALPVGGALPAPIIDRCNLTVLFEPGQEDTADFLKDHRVKIVASLPCYLEKNVDGQRGGGVFGKSIRALKIFNSLGYGKVGTGLDLDLVYNPLGAFLPPDQQALTADYKKQLRENYGIEFNQLYTIANMPIKRFADFLSRTGKQAEYMELLVSQFNPQAALGVMCRNLISIGWDGQIYDCDFNQMLELPLGFQRRTIWELESFEESADMIAFADHCYGCTAGAGSSCGGSIL